MGMFIMKIRDDKFEKDYYLEWSTVINAPLTYGYSLDEFKVNYNKRYTADDDTKLEDRLKRVEQNGISALPPYDNQEKYF
jgi:hypothetical protein